MAALRSASVVPFCSAVLGNFHSALDKRTCIPQRVWEIRVDTVLKLDRAAKRETNDDNQEEVPAEGHRLTTID